LRQVHPCVIEAADEAIRCLRQRRAEVERAGQPRDGKAPEMVKGLLAQQRRMRSIL
jgi:hypothetical protein